MKPLAHAPAVDITSDNSVDSEPDTYLDSDVDFATNDQEPAPADAGPHGALPDVRAAAVPRPRVPERGGPAESGLTERERQVLAFEQRWWRHAGAKEQAIRDTFGVSATRYYQILNGLLDNPAALAAEPVLISRLRRLRASQARARRR